MHVDKVGLIDEVAIICLSAQFNEIALGVSRDIPFDDVVLHGHSFRSIKQNHFVFLPVGEDVRRVGVGCALDRRQRRVADECEHILAVRHAV